VSNRGFPGENRTRTIPSTRQSTREPGQPLSQLYAGTRRQPDANPERWDLYEYVEVADRLKIIKPDTATLVRLAKDFPQSDPPGRAARLGQKCDRSTACTALAAVDAVARDLTP
jgi:hypothetical protein